MKLFEKFGLNPDWIKSGTGPMFLKIDQVYTPVEGPPEGFHLSLIHIWSRLTPYDEMTLSYVVLWLRWRRFFSRLAFAPFYEENPHGGIEAQIGLYSY